MYQLRINWYQSVLVGTNFKKLTRGRLFRILYFFLRNFLYKNKLEINIIMFKRFLNITMNSYTDTEFMVNFTLRLEKIDAGRSPKTNNSF